MSFLEEVRAASVIQGPTCTLALLMDDLPDDLREQVRAALDDPTINGEAIARALQNRGYKMRGSTVQRHRRKACACE